MRFWIVQAQEHPAEPRSNANRREWRSNTLTETLADRGHDVVRWRSAFSHHRKKHFAEGSEWIPAEGYGLQFIGTSGYRRHVGLRRIRSHRSLGRNFAQVAARYDVMPDLIHVGNVPTELCHAAVLFGSERGIPVVADVRDLWPDLYAEIIPQVVPGGRTIALSALNHRWSQARSALGGASSLTALTTSYLTWALEKAGRDRNELDAVFPMAHGAFVPMAAEQARARTEARLGMSVDGRVLAVYAGNIGTQSDFAAVINAAWTLRDQHPQLHVVLAGDGPELENIRAQAAEVDNVTVPGWLGGDDLKALLTVASVGLIAYKPTQNFLLNIPNKFPEYLAAGLAVACAVEGEMGELVRRHQCGFVYRGDDQADLAAQLGSLLSDPSRLPPMQDAAKALHAGAFSSERIYPRFAEHLEEIASR